MTCKQFLKPSLSLLALVFLLGQVISWEICFEKDESENAISVCKFGTQCFRKDALYAECRPSCPADPAWSCNRYGSSSRSCGVNYGRCKYPLKCLKKNKYFYACHTHCPREWRCHDELFAPTTTTMPNLPTVDAELARNIRDAVAATAADDDQETSDALGSSSSEIEILSSSSSLSSLSSEASPASVMAPISSISSSNNRAVGTFFPGETCGYRSGKCPRGMNCYKKTRSFYKCHTFCPRQWQCSSDRLQSQRDSLMPNVLRCSFHGESVLTRVSDKLTTLNTSVQLFNDCIKELFIGQRGRLGASNSRSRYRGSASNRRYGQLGSGNNGVLTSSNQIYSTGSS